MTTVLMSRVPTDDASLIQHFLLSPGVYGPVRWILIKQEDLLSKEPSSVHRAWVEVIAPTLGN
jgi:hypothetical protein